MVYIHRYRVEKVLLRDACIDNGRFESLLDPLGTPAYVLPHTCSHMAERLAQLLARPHVSIPEEELGPDEAPVVPFWI